MAVTRTVKSKIPVASKEPQAVENKKVAQVTESESSEGSTDSKRKVAGKKYCQFDRSKTEPHYWDASSLRRFISDRGRIQPRARSGACAKHQRKLSKEIKRARFLALLPFTPRV